MNRRWLKYMMLSFTALSVLTLAACDQDNEEEVSPTVVEETQEEPSETSYESQLDELEERLHALNEEDSEGQDVDLEQFEAEETLKDELTSLEDQVEREEDISRLNELLKEYGLIQTMASIKTDLGQVYDWDSQTVVSEEELPADFDMRLYSLSEEKVGFYETYSSYYEAYQTQLGMEVEEENPADQARINAIRSLLIMPDGSINPDVSDADLQQLYNELLSLGANETAAAVNAELERRANQAAQQEQDDQASNEGSAQPPAPQQPNPSSRPSQGGSQGTTPPAPSSNQSSQSNEQNNSKPQPDSDSSQGSNSQPSSSEESSESTNGE